MTVCGILLGEIKEVVRRRGEEKNKSCKRGRRKRGKVGVGSKVSHNSRNPPPLSKKPKKRGIDKLPGDCPEEHDNV